MKAARRLAIVVLMAIGMLAQACARPVPLPRAIVIEPIALPEPALNGDVSVERALQERRSVRAYGDGVIALHELSQLLWAAQGVSAPEQGLRTAPSAGALYPVHVYAVCRNVAGIAPGVYLYVPEAHEIYRVAPQGELPDAAALGLDGSAAEGAPVMLVFAADFSQTTQRYGERGRNYVYLEIGHAAQNAYLQAAALELGTVAIGAFDDARMKKALHLPQDRTPVYAMPVGTIAP